MIKAAVRPEKCAEILDKLNSNGFRAATRYSILGRGKQKGLKVADVYYDEIPKEMIMIVVDDSDEDKVVEIISQTARTSKNGAFGDGKIFVLPVERTVTISSGQEVL
jgi:nitrogen regulatory protein PII 1